MASQVVGPGNNGSGWEEQQLWEWSQVACKLGGRYINSKWDFDEKSMKINIKMQKTGV